MTQLEEHELTAGDVSERAEMIEAFDHLGPIERKIVCLLTSRLGMGQAQYGKFRENDPRHGPDEMVEEVTDALVYALQELIKIAKKYAVRDTEPSPAP